MFTCKPENRVGVYMLTSKRTGDTYVGASTNLPVRFASHQSDVRLQSWGSPLTNATWKPAFTDVSEIEFRVLEFIPAMFSDRRRGGVTRETQRKMLNREKYWIAKLQPSLNIRIDRTKIRIEDLPLGAPDPVPSK